jgi:crotonobetaine/carnitine-CoA ligase
VRVVDDQGVDCQPGLLGQLLIRGREPGLITPGYFRNRAASEASLRNGWLYTGDLARRDAEGFLYYCGRMTDSVRHQGENISAWEVERVINQHPDVEESALVGVETDVGEQDLKIFIKPAQGRTPDPDNILRWCRQQLPRYQIPRYIAFVEEFDKTPTLRIKKERLSRSTAGCWDRMHDRES